MLDFFGFIATIAMIGAFFSVCRSKLFHAFHDDKVAEEYAIRAYGKYTYPSAEIAEWAKESAISWSHRTDFKSQRDAKKFLHQRLQYWASCKPKYDR